MNRGILGLLLLTLAFFWGCEKEQGKGVFDPDYESKPAPHISSVDPSEKALAGVVRITLTGENYHSEPDQNTVWFNTVKCDILEASPSRLVVQSPDLVSDSIRIKVATYEADRFSNLFPYELMQSIFVYANYNKYDDPFCIARDNIGNLYVYNSPSIIEKVTPQQVRSEYGKLGRMKSATQMHIGPDGILYLVKNSDDVYRLESQGAIPTKWASADGLMYDFDFSSDHSLYAGGKGDHLYRITQDETSSVVGDYPDTYIKAVRIFDGYVYVGGTDETDSHVYIWRQRLLDDGTLEPKEVYFDWSEQVGEFTEILCMTFAADGTLYAGTDADAGIIMIHTSGEWEPLYPGLLYPPVYSMTWGVDEFLFASIRNQDVEKRTILKINMLKQGAPYYGLQ